MDNFIYSTDMTSAVNDNNKNNMTITVNNNYNIRRKKNSASLYFHLLNVAKYTTVYNVVCWLLLNLQ